MRRWTPEQLARHQRATARTLGFLAAWGAQQREARASAADRDAIAASLADLLRQQERLTNQLLAEHYTATASTGELRLTSPIAAAARTHRRRNPRV